MTLEDRGRRSAVQRAAVAQLRRDIRTGCVPLAEVLMNPPEALEQYAILDVVRLVRGVSRTRAPRWVERMGRAALRDQVNLAIPLGRASLQTRRWVARYADWDRRGVDGRRLITERAA